MGGWQAHTVVERAAAALRAAVLGGHEDVLRRHACGGGVRASVAQVCDTGV